MDICSITPDRWHSVRAIYREAFPKAERKPFFTLRRDVYNGKAQLLTAIEDDAVLGFALVIPYSNMVMVDYLAVSAKIRSRGAGSRILQEICRRFPEQKLVLLIEQMNEAAANAQQRAARRRFYFKNGFESSGIFIDGHSGCMEVLHYGGRVSASEYMALQKYALGRSMFKLSGIRRLQQA